MRGLGLTCLPILCIAAAALAQPEGPRSLPEGEPGPDQPPDGDAAALPGIELDREARRLELSGEVANREADWLELLVAKSGHRVHETILTTEAEPSHIHLALLMLGLEPGRPLQHEPEEDGQGWKVLPPRGPAVKIELIYQRDGQTLTHPASRWVHNNATDEPLQSDRWLFTGSQLVEADGERFYLADRNGTVISLVSFGDDLLARDTTTTNRTDQKQWAAVSERIPPEGTPVTICITPVDGDERPAGEN